MLPNSAELSKFYIRRAVLHPTNYTARAVYALLFFLLFGSANPIFCSPYYYLTSRARRADLCSSLLRQFSSFMMSRLQRNWHALMVRVGKYMEISLQPIFSTSFRCRSSSSSFCVQVGEPKAILLAWVAAELSMLLLSESLSWPALAVVLTLESGIGPSVMLLVLASKRRRVCFRVFPEAEGITGIRGWRYAMQPGMGVRTDKSNVCGKAVPSMLLFSLLDAAGAGLGAQYCTCCCCCCCCSWSCGKCGICGRGGSGGATCFFVA